MHIVRTHNHSHYYFHLCYYFSAWTIKSGQFLKIQQSVFSPKGYENFLKSNEYKT